MWNLERILLYCGAARLRGYISWRAPGPIGYDVRYGISPSWSRSAKLKKERLTARGREV